MFMISPRLQLAESGKWPGATMGNGKDRALRGLVQHGSKSRTLEDSLNIESFKCGACIEQGKSKGRGNNVL